MPPAHAKKNEQYIEPEHANTSSLLVLFGPCSNSAQVELLEDITRDPKTDPPSFSLGSYAAGFMFWFTQKKFVGSYSLLMAASRA